MSESIIRYFPALTEIQIERFSRLKEIYSSWNSRINVISRKDIENFYIHHVLHSLAISRIISFKPGTRVLDVGTGGGFPGVPLAIMFPLVHFNLLDSITKKIKVVSSVASELGIENINVINKRAEEEKGVYDFVVSRAVMDLPGFYQLVRKNIGNRSANSLGNGIIYLKGGDLSAELAPFGDRTEVWDISKFFEEPFFETKKIVYLPA